jgi:predicted metalloprotease
MGMGGGGGGGPLFSLLAMFVGRKFGIVGIVVLMGLFAVFGRGFGGGGSAPAPAPGDARTGGQSAVSTGEVARSGGIRTTPEEEKLVDFVSFVLDNSQQRWATLAPQQLGTQYRPARLVLFREAVATGCGNAPSAVGPFYCPRDERVYIDLSFYDELQRRYGAPGDFAQAYVLAHEIGHHLQKVTGTEARVRQLQSQRPQLKNALSVRLELQADCYAGVWAYGAARESRLEVGDVDEALGAAAAVGDDRLQQRSRGDVNPDSFTHGSAAQRQTWFKRGFESGDARSCDTFAGEV